MKYKYYIKVYKILYKIIKYISIYKMKYKILHYIVLCNSWYKINNLLIAIAKVKTIFLFIDLIKKNYLNNENKSLYRDNIDRKNLASIDNIAKMPKKNFGKYK